MTAIKKTILINAPINKVFDFVSNPNNLPVIWPSMVEVRDVQPSPVGGFNFSWTYKMAGMRFEGASETVENVPNRREVTKSKKGIENTFIWTYELEAGMTRVTVETEYTVPILLLGKLAEAFIVKQNEHEAEMILANLKVRMET
jgi:uncharacterized membrane protein